MYPFTILIRVSTGTPDSTATALTPPGCPFTALMILSRGVMGSIRHPNSVDRQPLLVWRPVYDPKMVKRETLRDLKPVVAANLRSLKKYRGMSQDGIAAAAGISQSSVGRAMSGATAADLDTLAGLAKALDVQPWQLLIPDLKPDNLPVLRAVDAAEEALYERMRTLTAELAELQRRGGR